jgi:hypothetical protein
VASFIKYFGKVPNELAQRNIIEVDSQSLKVDCIRGFGSKALKTGG